jgi:PilZ domain
MSTSLTFERRQARRYRVALPVETGALGTGRTRDVSTAGVFFETDESLVPGSAIRFSLILEQGLLDVPVRLLCEGDVVRVERRDEQLGVAATINAFRFDPDTEPVARART